MKDLAVLFIGGVVGVAMITAFGLHSSGLANLASSTGKAGQGLIGTAETGNA